ncbi:MAG: hypothetical protein OEM63_06675, partial [Gammaproteobacteria bacterium]|nr:hypothetical protein [Gammaproteobacteria bacterium]
MMLSISVLVLSGCATTPGAPPAAESPRSNSRLEVLDQVGFTITEEEPVKDDIRLAYEEALHLIETGALEQGVAN